MTLQKSNRVFFGIEKFQIHCSWVTTVFVTLMIVLDIALRALFNRPLPASWEISEVLMPYIVAFGFAYTLTIDKHIRVSMVTDLFPVKMQIRVRCFTDLLSFLMCSLITYYSCIWFWESFSINEQILAAIDIPWWFGKVAMPIAFATFGIRYLLLAIFALVGIKPDPTARR
jgi:TRAP-type C4-dicarboxylate transport system permease small subunit